MSAGGTNERRGGMRTSAGGTSECGGVQASTGDGKNEREQVRGVCRGGTNMHGGGGGANEHEASAGGTNECRGMNAAMTAAGMAAAVLCGPLPLSPPSPFYYLFY